MNNIVVYYPSQRLGGAQVHVLNAANFFYDLGYNIYFAADDSDFLQAKFLETNPSTLSSIVSKQPYKKRYEVSSEFILMTTLDYLLSVRTFVDLSKCKKILFFDMHPSNVIWQIPFGKLLKSENVILNFILKKIILRACFKRVSFLLQSGIASKSISFLCRRDYEINQYVFGIAEDALYFPARPAEIAHSFREKSRALEEKPCMDVLWVSRLDDEKVKILNLLIEDLESYCLSTGASVTLNIVGHGNALTKIIQTFKVQLVTHGIMHGERLHNFALKKIDISFGMGIAALEIGELGIPTFFVPSMDEYHFFKRRSKRYLPIFQVSGYDVAVETKHSEFAMSLVESIRLIGSLSDFGLQCRGHVVKNHHNNTHGLREMLSLTSESQDFVRDVELFRYSLVERFLFNLQDKLKKIIGRYL